MNIDELRTDEEAEVSFIEKLQCLPISMTSTENLDYIEMGSLIYFMALDFMEEKLNGEHTCIDEYNFS